MFHSVRDSLQHSTRRKPAASSPERENARSLPRVLKGVGACGYCESRDSALRDGVWWKRVGQQLLQRRDVRPRFMAAKTTTAL